MSYWTDPVLESRLKNYIGTLRNLVVFLITALVHPESRLLTSLVLIRWKHAAACHQDSTLPGEGEYYETDDVLIKLLSLTSAYAAT
jgi:hypothetical protein